LVLLVDTRELGIAEHHRRFPIENRDALLHKRGLAEIVVALPLEVLARGAFKDEIVVPGSAPIHFLAKISNPRVARGVVTANLFRSVTGAVVRYDQFKVGKALL